MLEKQSLSTIRFISDSNRFLVLLARNGWLRAVHRGDRQTDGFCRAGCLLTASYGVTITGSQCGWIKELLEMKFCCKQTAAGYLVPWSAVRGPAAAHGFFLELKMSHFKVTEFSFLLLHFLCFLKINKKWEPGNSLERSCSLFVLWKYFLLFNFVTLVNNSRSFPIKLAPSKLITILRTELQSREDHLGSLKMKYFLLPTHLAFLCSFALSKPVQVCPCSGMLRIYIAAAELLYLKIN